MIYRVKSCLGASIVLLSLQAAPAANLSNIQVSNGEKQARITFNFVGNPEYALSQSDKCSFTLNFKQIGAIQGLPLRFSGDNLLKSIRSGTPKDSPSIRLVVDLTEKGEIRAIKQKNGSNYMLVFTINADISPPLLLRPVVIKQVWKAVVPPARTRSSPSKSLDHHTTANMTRIGSSTSNNTVMATAISTRALSGKKVVIAIDAGHGGQDPGAVGPGGTKEKNVTIAIARKLRAMLNDNSMFKAVLTRNGDYFISVMGRSDVARKQNANFLVSIHADAALNRNASGASVWVLSNRRANNEMAGWMEQHERQSELLGGAGHVLANLANAQDYPYLSQAVLDLQFGHSQRVGYDAALDVLGQLERVGSLHKRRPEHASLGVLRSPDIPSILVETGFISNNSEERLFLSYKYQWQIAQAIYNGLQIYFETHPLQSVPPHAFGEQPTRALLSRS